MAAVIQPWQILVAAFAGWLSRQQDAVIEYLREENRVLKQQLGRRRLRLTERLAAHQLQDGRGDSAESVGQYTSVAITDRPGLKRHYDASTGQLIIQWKLAGFGQLAIEVGP